MTFVAAGPSLQSKLAAEKGLDVLQRAKNILRQRLAPVRTGECPHQLPAFRVSTVACTEASGGVVASAPRRA